MADGIFAKELEDELMKYTTKQDCKVVTNLVDKTAEVQMNGDVDVNILECSKSLGNELVTTECQNTTESSSSFDECNSGIEDVDTLNDCEASSEFRDDVAPALGFPGFGERLRMRKKKLTTHWRSFIQPLMWRCKWVELQINQLQSQARQYDREVEACNKQKQTQIDTTAVDGVRSLPFLQKNAGRDIFRRKKRRRVEATTDLAAYMSRHNLFSCYENKKYLTEGGFTNNEPKNPGTQTIQMEDDIWDNNDLLSFEPEDDDNSVEQLLRKIAVLQSHVGDLKSKVDMIKRENAARLNFADTLNLLPSDDENGTEGTYIMSQPTSTLPSQTAVTSHADFPVPNRSIVHALVGAHKNVEDGVLIDNQKAKKEMNNAEEEKIHPIQKPTELKDGSGNGALPILPEPDPFADHSPPKIRSIAKLTAPKGKRKRGRKKGSTSRRRKKPSR